MDDVIEKDADLTGKPEEVAAEKKELTLEEVMAELQNVKKAQAGSDKAYQAEAKKAKQLADELERMKLEKMTDEEKAKHLLEEKDKILAERERKVTDATLRLSTLKALSDKSMDADFADFVTGADENAISENIDKLNELIQKQVGKRVEETLSGASKPKAGASGDGKTQAQKLAGLSLFDLEKQIRDGLITS